MTRDEELSVLANVQKYIVQCGLSYTEKGQEHPQQKLIDQLDKLIDEKTGKLVDVEGFMLKTCPICSDTPHFARNMFGRYRHFVTCGGCGLKTKGTAFQNDEFNAKEWNNL